MYQKYPDKVKILNKYREAKKEFMRARANLEELETLLFSTSSPTNKAKVKKSKSPDKLSIHMDELIRLQRKCEEKQGTALREMRKVLDLIERAGDGIGKDILTKKYIHGLRWEQIAIDLNYEYSYLSRLHNKAIEEVFDIARKR